MTEFLRDKKIIDVYGGKIFLVQFKDNGEYGIINQPNDVAVLPKDYIRIDAQTEDDAKRIGYDMAKELDWL